MKIEKITKIDWQSYLNNQKHVSLFELPIWYSIWEEYFNTSSTAFLVNDHLLISTIHLKGAKGFIKFNNSSPAGTYSNFRSVSGKTRLSASDFKEIQKMTKVHHLRLSPFSNISISNDYDDFNEDLTHILNLSDVDKIDSSWSRNHKRMYQKAIDSKLNVKKSNDQNEWKEYYELYKNFVIGKGNQSSSFYQSRLFESIFDIDNKYRDLWIVKKQDKVIAGRLVFYTSDYAVEWHANSNEEANSIGANQLLLYQILLDAKKRNIDIYDFNPSGGNEGVVAFKEKFGATRIHSTVFKNYNLFQKWYLNRH